MKGIRALARHLPPDSLAVFEVRLAAGAGGVDFSLRLAARPPARHLAGRFSSAHLQSFLARWAGEADGLAPVSALWLEFDLDPGSPPGEAESLPLPVVCAQLRGRVESGWLSESLFPALHGRPLSVAQRRLVGHCVSALPAGGKVLYAFSLRSRPGAAVRLELYGLDPAAMVDYLRRIAEPAAARRVAALLPLIADCERPHLSFDLGEEISPRLGLEGSFVHLPDDEPRWAELFDRLVARGLCSTEKRAAVFAWPGYDSLRTAARRWPAAGMAAGGYCVRCLSHVKLVSWPDREAEAKAYLVFQHLRPAAGGGAPPPPARDHD